MLILAAVVDKSSVSTTTFGFKIMIGLVWAFVLEASERQKAAVFLNTAVCRRHRNEVMYLFVAL